MSEESLRAAPFPGLTLEVRGRPGPFGHRRRRPESETALERPEKATRCTMPSAWESKTEISDKARFSQQPNSGLVFPLGSIPAEEVFTS